MGARDGAKQNGGEGLQIKKQQHKRLKSKATRDGAQANKQKKSKHKTNIKHGEPGGCLPSCARQKLAHNHLVQPNLLFHSISSPYPYIYFPNSLIPKPDTGRWSFGAVARRVGGAVGGGGGGGVRGAGGWMDVVGWRGVWRMRGLAGAATRGAGRPVGGAGRPASGRGRLMATRKKWQRMEIPRNIGTRAEPKNKNDEMVHEKPKPVTRTRPRVTLLAPVGAAAQAGYPPLPRLPRPLPAAGQSHNKRGA
jgi:hypothetical protein